MFLTAGRMTGTIIFLSFFVILVSGFPDRKDFQSVYRSLQKLDSNGLSEEKKSLLGNVGSIISGHPKLVQQMVSQFEHTVDKDVAVQSGHCSCLGYNCGCCLHVEVKAIDLNDTVCANISYLPAPEYGISVTLSLDGKIYVNKTISARNPPLVCAGIPYLKKYASICLKFTKLTVTNCSFSGCAAIVARLEGFSIEDFPLGCFKIPPGGVALGQGNNDRVFIERQKSNPCIDDKLYFKSKKEVIISN